MDTIAGKDRMKRLLKEPAGRRAATPAVQAVDDRAGLPPRGAESASSPLEQLYEPIRDELAACEAILRDQLRNDNPLIDRLVRHGFRLGGKRLRPALLLLAAKVAGGVRPEHLVLAAVVEMIHTATLVHDDVLDEAAVRRHVDTINARWGNQASVLVGDYLFTHAFYLASTLSDTFACRTIGRATNLVCEGELRQIESQGNFELSEQQYLEIIEAKTAELCCCSCLLGAHYAGASPAVEQALSHYGRWLGIAFQIADDVLDLVGQEQTAGKSLGTDLAQQKPTLPVIHLLARAGAGRRAELLKRLADPANETAPLQTWPGGAQAIAYSRRVAGDFANQARNQLISLPAGPARNVLHHLTEFVVDRRQ